MRKVVLLAAAVMLAAPAFAEFVGNADKSSAPIYEAQLVGDRADYNGTAYSNMTLGTNYSVSATGAVVSVDDYTSVVAPADTILMSTFKFVGGVANAGEVLFFTFFDSSGSYVDSFGAQFSQGGNFVWTVTLSTPFAVANSGYVQMWADDGSVLVTSTGSWFMTTDAPTIGTTGTAYPGYTTSGGAYLDHKFEINSIPEPATIGLLGLSVLALVRRR